MTIDLACLAGNALWGFVLVLIEIFGKTKIAGKAWNAGNREKEPTFPPWIDRAGRALGNHKENFPLFLTAVVVVHLAGKQDKVSAIAALVYVAARLAHGLLYIGGVTKVRTMAFSVGAIATLVIFSRLAF